MWWNPLLKGRRKWIFTLLLSHSPRPHYVIGVLTVNWLLSIYSEWSELWAAPITLLFIPFHSDNWREARSRAFWNRARITLSWKSRDRWVSLHPSNARTNYEWQNTHIKLLILRLLVQSKVPPISVDNSSSKSYILIIIWSVYLIYVLAMFTDLL